MSEWLSLKAAALKLGVSESTVYRIVKEPETADTEYGPGNWRRRPNTRRVIYQLRASRVDELVPDSPAE